MAFKKDSYCCLSSGNKLLIFQKVIPFGKHRLFLSKRASTNLGGINERSLLLIFPGI